MRDLSRFGWARITKRCRDEVGDYCPIGPGWFYERMERHNQSLQITVLEVVSPDGPWYDLGR